MSADDERTRVVAATLRAVGGFVALALLVGVALPLHRGWLLPLAVVVAAVAVRTLRRGVAMPTYTRAGRGARAVLFLLTAVPVVVFVTVGARAIASVVIAYPGALWGVPVVLAAIVLPSLRRGALPIVAALAVLVPVAGVVGTRFEAGAEDARGWMESGPIHGIHPGQTTALLVDGYGPFDLPVNDYVEPTGERGYGPEAFAAMVEEALHEIAKVHFADGPARARMAFAEAEAEAIVTEPVRERLDRDPGATEHQRFIVRSGSFGQRSRVEFVCPGRRDDPRGHQGDNIMNRMCPTKYASEASAGLGVTGRWPGYAEGRGNERLGLARALGWTRSDDAAGQGLLTTEQRLVAWIVLAVLVGLVALPRPRAAQGMAMLGGALGIAAIALMLALALAGEGAQVQVGIVESPHGATLGDSIVAWLPVCLIVGGLPAFGGDELGEAHARGEQWAGRIAAAAIAVVVLLLAAKLSGLEIIAPQLGGELDGELSLQRFVAGLADATGERFGLGILEVEGAIASAVVAGLLGGLAHALRITSHAAAGLAPAPTGHDHAPRGLVVVDAPARYRLLGLLAVALSAAAIIVSRKTLGGAALVPGAIALTLVLHGGLQVLAARDRRVSLPLQLLPLGLQVAVAFVCIAHGAASVDPHPFVLFCAFAGGLVALSALALPWLSRPGPDA